MLSTTWNAGSVSTCYLIFWQLCLPVLLIVWLGKSCWKGVWCVIVSYCNNGQSGQRKQSDIKSGGMQHSQTNSSNYSDGSFSVEKDGSFVQGEHWAKQAALLRNHSEVLHSLPAIYRVSTNSLRSARIVTMTLFLSRSSRAGLSPAVYKRAFWVHQSVTFPVLFPSHRSIVASNESFLQQDSKRRLWDLQLTKMMKVFHSRLVHLSNPTKQIKPKLCNVNMAR